MTPIPEPGIVWTSLPIPALILDAGNRITHTNPAAENFLNASARQLRGTPALDRLAIDAPLEEAFARVRENQSAVFLNDVEVGTGERPPGQCTVQIAPISDRPEALLLLISPRDIADRLGQSKTVKSAAESAIGMA